MSSFTCRDPITGQRLESYDDEWTARVELAKNWYLRAAPTQARKCGECGKFHLYPESHELNLNPQKLCPMCRRGNGGSKQAYPNSISAVAAMTGLTEDRGLGTRAYPCPQGNGWHVTTETGYDYFKAVREFEEAKLNHFRIERRKGQEVENQTMLDTLMRRRAEIKKKRSEGSGGNK